MTSRSVFEKEMIPHNLLIHKISQIEGSTYLRDRALIACLALGGFRISEIVGIKNKDHIKTLRNRVRAIKNKISIETDKKELKRLERVRRDLVKSGKRIAKELEIMPQSYHVQPLKKYQCRRIVQIKDGKEYKFLQFEQVTILKRKEKIMTKKSPPLPYHKEKDLILFFWNYVKRFKNEEAILFPITRRHSLRIIKKALGNEYYNHYLRHHRITRLLGNDYNFTMQQAKTFIGSKDIRSLDPYSHIGTGDIRDKMI